MLGLIFGMHDPWSSLQPESSLVAAWEMFQLWHIGSLVVACELLVAVKLLSVGPSPLISSGTRASCIGSAESTPGPLRKSLGVVQMKEQPGRKTELVSESNLDSLNFFQLRSTPTLKIQSSNGKERYFLNSILDWFGVPCPRMPQILWHLLDLKDSSGSVVSSRMKLFIIIVKTDIV